MVQATARMIVVALLVAFVAPAASQAAEFGFRGWGPRVGISSDPDQVFVGAHFDLGEFAENVRFQPSFEIGFGDDTTTYAGNFMVAYYFPVEGEVTPYVGGQLSAVFFDFDNCGDFPRQFTNGSCDDSDTEIGPSAVGGIELKLESKARFLAELQLGFADLPEVKLLAGWTF